MRNDISAIMLAEYRKREDGIIVTALETYLKRDMNNNDVALVRKVYKYKTNTRYALYYGDVHVGDMKLTKKRITFKSVG